LPHWVEVRSLIEQTVGLAQWRADRPKLLGLPIEIVPVDQELAELAEEMTAIEKASSADYVAAALYVFPIFATSAK
jgi:hypothetical protein